MTTRRGPEREPALPGDSLYDCIIFAAHPDDAEGQMGGTIARLGLRPQLDRKKRFRRKVGGQNLPVR